jgi:hypothetical protein
MKDKINYFFDKQKIIGEDSCYLIKANLFYEACAAKEKNNNFN